MSNRKVCDNCGEAMVGADYLEQYAVVLPDAKPATVNASYQRASVDICSPECLVLFVAQEVTGRFKLRAETRA